MLRLNTALGLLLLMLTGCVVQERQPRPAPPTPTPVPTPTPIPTPVPTPALACALPPLPPAARMTCAPAVRPVGILAILRSAACRNNHTAVDGERVCDGDYLTTTASGVAEVIPFGDRESDSVHIAEGTDPRFSWTAGDCLSVDNYRHGRVIATAQQRCMIIRTPDTLMLLLNGRVQFEVTRGAGTRVVPLRGSLIKLQPLTAQQVYALKPSELRQYQVAAPLQPQLHSINVYVNHNVTQPAVRLPPSEIKRIDSSVLRRAINLPPAPP